MIFVYHYKPDPEGDRAARLRRLDFTDAVRDVSYSNRAVPQVDLSNYDLVAKVRTNDKEEAYIAVHDEPNCNWQQHPLMDWAAPPPQKAGTDIGDLMIDENGDWWLVAAFGFILVPGTLRVSCATEANATPADRTSESIRPGVPELE